MVGRHGQPILDTTKQVGSKSDHYFLVGMTRNPDEIRSNWFVRTHNWFYTHTHNVHPEIINTEIRHTYILYCTTYLLLIDSSRQYCHPHTLTPSHPHRAILCKGLMFPPVHPRPVMTVLPLQLPLCEISSERTQLEVCVCVCACMCVCVHVCVHVHVCVCTRVYMRITMLP